MDSDVEYSDDDSFDYDHNFFDNHPFPASCQNATEGIELFYKCFIHRYSACPAFFMGSLSEACQSTFSSSVVKEHRPILVYVHHDRSPLSNIFCSKIFCSEIMVDYLLENYIVWPWDITYESNKNTLMEIWQALSTKFFVHFSVEQCPMLIGIMRRSNKGKGWLSPFDYQCTLLQQCDTLTRTQVESSRERLLNELIIFKERCDENEKVLAFDFIQTTGLPLEIFLEIIKYLYLNDIVYAFSSNILPFLNKYNARLHLSDPSEQFINLIYQKIKPEQIISLHSNKNAYYPVMTIVPRTMFSNLISLTLVNLQDIDQLKQLEMYFPNLVSLSLRYDYEVTYYQMIDILQTLRNPIRRLEFHCAINTYFTNLLPMGLIQNTTIEYFLLDMVNFMNDLVQDYNRDVLVNTMDFIKRMINIRYIHLIINYSKFERFFNQTEWKNLINECRQLTKITFQVTENISNHEQLTEKILQIQKDVRENIKFQIKYK